MGELSLAHDAFLIQRGEFSHDNFLDSDSIGALVLAADMVCELIPDGTGIDLYSGDSSQIVESARIVHDVLRISRKVRWFDPDNNWEFSSLDMPGAKVSTGPYDALKLGDAIDDGSKRGNIPVVVTNNPFIEDFFIFAKHHGLNGNGEDSGRIPGFGGYGHLYGITLEQCDGIVSARDHTKLIDYIDRRPDLFENPEELRTRLRKVMQVGKIVR